MKLILRIYYRTIIWLVLMFYMLFSPGSGLPKTGIFNIPYFDKIVHFGMFSLLLFLFLYESQKSNKKAAFYIIYLSIFLIFSALSEVIQYKFIQGRSGNMYDFYADFIGLIFGGIFYKFLWKKNIQST
jgi:VanZ family protein